MSLLSVSSSAVTAISDAGWRVLAVILETDPTPQPLPPIEIDEDLVTPTWVGFALTFLVAAATLLLIIDMMRRVRRTRYRAEVQEKLAVEQAEAAAAAQAAATATPAVPASNPPTTRAKASPQSAAKQATKKSPKKSS